MPNRDFAFQLDINRLARQWVFNELDFMTFIDELEACHEFYDKSYPEILEAICPAILQMERAERLSRTAQIKDHIRVTGHPPTH